MNPEMARLILLVHADVTARRRIETLLSGAGYLVSAVSSFKEAKKLLYSVSPDLLIADVQLGAFNGLQLAVHSRLTHPALPVIITHAWRDLVLENDARRQGATFIVDPLENRQFLRTVQSALDQPRSPSAQRIRQWQRKRIKSTMDAELATSRARILDMSYGGLKLVFARERDLPSEFDVIVPAAGITVKAHRVWTSQSPTTDEFWCGAEVADLATSAESDWRHFVDSVELT